MADNTTGAHPTSARPATSTCRRQAALLRGRRPLGAADRLRPRAAGEREPLAQGRAAAGDRFRCVALDLPLGSHELPLPDADVSPTGLADLIADALDALDLDDVTLVGNDTGGGLCQIAITREPERVGRLVPDLLRRLRELPAEVLRLPEVVGEDAGRDVRLGFAPLRLEAPRSLPIAFGWLVHRKIDRRGDRQLRAAGDHGEGAARDDVRRVLPQFDPKYLLDAAAKFGEFKKPVLIAWSEDDKFFPLPHADRLAAAFPDARVEWI